MTNVFIDGSAGTTGLQIVDRLSERKDISLISLSGEQRKDSAARREAINSADIVFLCLPDAAAVESVSLVENPSVKIIDTSTAHRTNPAWAYGFPELSAKHREAVAGSLRVANPGCHATGFISIVYPLVSMGILPADAALSCFSLTGYSGGGKKMIADYEGDGKSGVMCSPGIYGLMQNHKHLPEMRKVCGLEHSPVFSPIVDDYYKGMVTTVPLHMSQLQGVSSVCELRGRLAEYYGEYNGTRMVWVGGEDAVDTSSKFYGNARAGSDSLSIMVAGNDRQLTVTALFDNLGKGASGAAIQNMNIMLGLDETTGLKI